MRQTVYPRQATSAIPASVAQQKQKGAGLSFNDRRPEAAKLSGQMQTIQRVMYVTKNYMVLQGSLIDKFLRITSDLDEMGLHMDGNDFDLHINVIDTNSSNPASTGMHNGNISIDLQKWYINISTEGQILGLLAHELGVHHLANKKMPQYTKDLEERNQKKNFNVEVNGRDFQVKKWKNKNQYRDERGRQLDHTNVVRDKGKLNKGIGARAKVYGDTMLRMGDAIEQSNRAAPEKTAEQKSLLETFLFDYARILATDDGKALSTMWNANIIGEVFSWYKTVIMDRHSEQHDWLQKPELDVEAGYLKTWLLGKVMQFIGDRAVNQAGKVKTSVSGGISRGAGMVYGGISRGANLAYEGLGRVTAPVSEQLWRGARRMGQVGRFMANQMPQLPRPML